MLQDLKFQRISKWLGRERGCSVCALTWWWEQLMLKSSYWKRLQALFAFPREDTEFLVKQHPRSSRLWTALCVILLVLLKFFFEWFWHLYTEHKGGGFCAENRGLRFKKSNFSLHPLPTRCSCLKITLELWVTSTEVQDGSELSQAFLQLEWNSSQADYLASNAHVRCPLLWVTAINPEYPFSICFLDLLLPPQFVLFLKFIPLKYFLLYNWT